MTPKDIIVGTLYTHAEHPHILYLGCGDLFNGLPLKRKFLIILTESPHSFSGIKVKYSKTNQSWWNKIYPVPQPIPKKPKKKFSPSFFLPPT